MALRDSSKPALENILPRCPTPGRVPLSSLSLSLSLCLILCRAVRSVVWGDGSKIFATASDPFTSREHGLISIFDFPDDLANAPTADEAPLHSPRLEIPVDDLNKATCLAWSNLNRHIIAGFDSGMIIKYDAETGKELFRTSAIHEDRVNRLNFNADKTLFITASKDTTSKLVDPETMEVIKIFRTDRPVNGAVINPIKPHVLVGGGQDAMSVTVTAANQGKFETRFFHSIYEEEFGRVKGHFGPINAIAIHPQGTSFASGSEDGYATVTLPLSLLTASLSLIGLFGYITLTLLI
jgi:translation initiation factor 3 subunit I